MSWGRAQIRWSTEIWNYNLLCFILYRCHPSIIDNRYVDCFVHVWKGRLSAMVTIHSSPLLPFYHVVLNFRSLYVFCHQFKGLNCFSPQISGHIVYSGSYSRRNATAVSGWVLACVTGCVWRRCSEERRFCVRIGTCDCMQRCILRRWRSFYTICSAAGNHFHKCLFN